MQRRIFLAFPVPTKITKSLSTYASAIQQEEFRWVKPENYHITISFFGEQEDTLIPQVTEKLRELISSIGPFVLTFNTIAKAPPHKTPTMLWAEYHSSETFTGLVRAVEKTTATIMSYPDKREGQTPIPHITLVRFKHTLPEDIPQIDLQPIRATTCILYESRKTDAGSTYTALEEFSFAS